MLIECPLLHSGRSTVTITSKAYVSVERFATWIRVSHLFIQQILLCLPQTKHDASHYGACRDEEGQNIMSVQKNGGHTSLERAQDQGIFYRVKPLTVHINNFGICGEKVSQEKAFVVT